MLAIRLQRTGRSGHAQYRVIVQDSRFTPTSGRYTAQIGTYNPHTKDVKIDTEKAAMYLANGAQPSDRVVYLLEKEGVKMPSWVKKASKKTGAIKNTDKLRRNRPAEEVVADAPAAEEASEPAEAVVAEEAVEVVAEAPAEVTETPEA